MKVGAGAGAGAGARAGARARARAGAMKAMIYWVPRTWVKLTIL